MTSIHFLVELDDKDQNNRSGNIKKNSKKLYQIQHNWHTKLLKNLEKKKLIHQIVWSKLTLKTLFIFFLHKLEG